MSRLPISDEMALRIGLAARALPDTDPARLLRVLAAGIGLPPTQERLAKLQVKDLQQAADGELAEIDPAHLKAALALLQGKVDSGREPPPSCDSYEEGDLPGSIRVACASNQGEELDGHFGSARRFLIYQVASSAVRLIAVRDAVLAHGAEDDKSSFRASLIQDCQILVVASIGASAAAKVVKRGIHPIKWPGGGNARICIESLQTVLGERAPPWLAKIMGQAPEARIRYNQPPSEIGQAFQTLEY
jgi:nitrogen fixation protein NifX